MFFKKPVLNLEKLKGNSFEDELNTCLKLKEIFKDKKLKKDRVVFLNLGAGGDIINPVLFADALIEAKEIVFLFYDPRFYYQFIIGELEDIIDNFKYKLKLNKNTATIKFKLNNTKMSIVYSGRNAFDGMPPEIKQGFDVYYERAFRLFRDDQNTFMYLLFQRMNKNGLVVTDWGFENIITEKTNLQKINGIPKDFGIYHNLTIYKKL